MEFKYTKLQLALEIVALLLLVGMITFVDIQWNQLPQQIPSHYNAMGEIDSWGSKTQVLFMPVLSILLYVLIAAVSFFPKIWNVPTKVTNENKEIVYRYTKNLLLAIKVEMMCAFSTITYYIASAKQLPVIFLPVFLIIAIGTPIFYTVRISQLGAKKVEVD